MQKATRIFLVDDDLDDQEFFVEAINEIGNAVLCGIANNGVEAIFKLKIQQPHPDIIFMDYNMPLMNGIDCFNEIMKDPELRNIPVVFLSANIETVKKVQNIGAMSFLKKSGDFGTLKTELERILNMDFIVTKNENKTFQIGQPAS